LSDRGLSDEQIIRPEESYRVWCVWVWSWRLDKEEALAHWGLLAAWGGGNYIFIYLSHSLRHVSAR